MIFTGKVEDDEIKALYMNAIAFVFPSLYEGFGIPPLEAMECGCPVAVSDIDVLHEVCGDAALYFDPHSTYEIEQALHTLYIDGDLKQQLIIKGRQQAAQFNWNVIGVRILNLIKENI